VLNTGKPARIGWQIDVVCATIERNLVGSSAEARIVLEMKGTDVSWWRGLFGLGRGERGRKGRVCARIEKARARAAGDPHRGLASLARLGRREVALVGLGGPLHQPFRDAVIVAWTGIRGGDPVKLPTATLVSWRRWREPTASSVVEWARRQDHSVLVVVDDDGHSRRDAVLQLDALRQFAERPSVAMVTIDGIDLFARRRFLVHVGAGEVGVPRDIIRELADRAGAVGYEVVTDPDGSV